MMTLKDLKGCVRVADKTTRVPKRRELLNMGVEVVANANIGHDVAIYVFARL